MSEQDKYLQDYYDRVLKVTGAIFDQEVTQETKNELYNEVTLRAIRDLDIALAKLKAFAPLASNLPSDTRISLSDFAKESYDKIGMVIEEINRLFPSE